MVKRRRPQSLARWCNRKPGAPTPSDGDIVYGDIAMRSAVRLVPLVGDGDEEPDGWGVV